MSVNGHHQIPDYDLDEMIVVTAPVQLRALADGLRGTLLELVLERAATVSEMASAVGRPKSTVAYHVNLLVDDEGHDVDVSPSTPVRASEALGRGRVAPTSTRPVGNSAAAGRQQPTRQPKSKRGKK